MSETLDRAPLVIIGGGPGGYAAAFKAAVNAYETAKDNGALGGKISGAGGGRATAPPIPRDRIRRTRPAPAFPREQRCGGQTCLVCGRPN